MEVGQLVGRHRVGQVIALGQVAAEVQFDPMVVDALANLAIGLTWPPARTVPGADADADNRDRVADRP